MLQDLREEQRTGRCAADSSETRDVGLAAVLSTIVALAVVVTAVLRWHADAAAQRPFNLLGIVIHCVLAGSSDYSWRPWSSKGSSGNVFLLQRTYHNRWIASMLVATDLRSRCKMVPNPLGIVSPQAILVAAWTLAVVMTGYLNWHDDVVAHRCVNPLGIVIQCALAAGVGLGLITLAGMYVSAGSLLVGAAPC